ncbi:acid-sensing ion channel 5-like [Drosophila ficusphila]|uniref:acid-sensing ion channel 5-like n=1 Tax=Drosophila ficusphila TaxID=30025 RepID=UPI0007E60932|nr:acid-sensing ion channel 5-like [Drosophila ficusphila]
MCTKFIILYFNNCCIHGFNYVVKQKLMFFERVLWFSLVAVSIYFCFIVCFSSVDRYLTKSTHIGVEKNYLFWNTAVPSLTVCPSDRLDITLFDDYCRQKDIEGSEKEAFWDFIENLANSTYMNFQNIPGDDEVDKVIKKLGLKPKHYMELIYNLTFDGTFEASERLRIRCYDGPTKIQVRQVLTEWGLCYLGSSDLGQEYSSRYLIFGEYPKYNKYQQSPEILKYMVGGFFDDNVQYTLLGFTSSAVFSFVHSAFDVMKVDTGSEYAKEGIFYDVFSEEIISEENLKTETTIAMRKCRFHHESNLTHFPFYTKNICLQECRINLAYERCKCIPHFYPNLIAKPKPVCDYKTLRSCFPRYSNLFLKLYDKDDQLKKPFPCYCEQNCYDASVTTKATNSLSGSKNLLGSIGGHVQVKSWPQRRLKRQVIFSMTDLLVSIGGTAGFFLGFSFLGLVEFVYFFTLRLFWQILGYTI